MWLGCLALCCLVAGSFWKARDVMMKAEQCLTMPVDRAGLPGLFASIRNLESANTRFAWLPRFGLAAETGAMERIRVRFCELYEEQVVKPVAAEEQASARNLLPGIHSAKALLRIAVLRRELLGHSSQMAQILPQDTLERREMLHRYRAWRTATVEARRMDSELGETSHILGEKLFVDNAMAWLPAWAAERVGGGYIDTAAVWEPVTLPAAEREKRQINAAWSGEAYVAAKVMLEDLAEAIPEMLTPERRDRILSVYRENSVAAWQDAVRRLWLGCRQNIGEEETSKLLLLLADGEDPVSRLRLSAMLADLDTASVAALLCDTPADFEREIARTARIAASPACLQLLGGYLAGEGMDNPLVRTGEQAAALTRHSGPMSALALHDFIRYLLLRNAAAALNRRWRDEVHTPSLLAAASQGAGAEPATRIRQRVDAFLSGTARGLWKLENGGIRGNERDRLVFPLERDFLDYCGWLFSENVTAVDGGGKLRLRVERVSVNPGARELPHYTEFSLADGDGQKLIHRNYPATAEFAWNGKDAEGLDVRVVFPSGEARWSGSRESVAAFAAKPGGDNYILRAEDATQGHDLLVRLKVGGIAIRGSVQNPELVSVGMRKAPALPATVAVHGYPQYNNGAEFYGSAR